MPAGDGKLVGEVSGEIEKDDKGTLVIRRIHVVYTLEGGGEHRETVERVHGIHKEHCPVYQSLKAAIDITTELKLT